MRKTLSLDFRGALAAQHSGQVLVVLLTIDHTSTGGNPIRICSHPTTRLSTAPLLYGTVSRGQTFYFVPFSLVLPEEKDGVAPKQRVRLDNIDRQIVGLLRSILTPATVKAELVLSASPDTVEIDGAVFDLTVANYDASTVELDLEIDALQYEPVPYGTFNPAQFPGLF